MKNIQVSNETSGGDFVFPEFKTEGLRIKSLTQRYKESSVIEAFADYYNLKDLRSIPSYAENFVFQDIALGSRVKVKFDNVTKGKVSIISNNPKEVFTTKHNVWTWPRLNSDLWYDGLVVDKKNGQCYVDIIEPMKEHYMNSCRKTLKNYFQSTQVTVKNLQIQRGGYLGTINIEPISRMTGQPCELSAFIPGSMIALNIEKDFNKWNGKDVEAMIINFADNNGNLSVICSRKKLLNSIGQTSLISLYDNVFADGGSYDQVFDGVVTGVINSAKKKGVFVEIPEYSMTGLVQIEPAQLVNYRIGDNVQCKITGVDWDERKEPYQRNRDGIIFECNLKPILSFI